jgi:hypothetical protein
MPAPDGWFLTVPTAHKDHLGAVRQWPPLKMAVADDAVWVTGFDAAQIASVTVQRIPYKTVYYSVGNKLFRQGSLLPDRHVPALLWSPMERGLPVTLPSYRGNYVDNQPIVLPKIVPADAVRETVAVRVRLADLGPYLQTAPAIRLQSLRWVLLGDDSALVMGTPILPVPGDGFWQRGDLLLPAGYDFDLFVLADLLNTRVNYDGQHWLVWQPDSSYFRAPKQATQPLSIASFRGCTGGSIVSDFYQPLPNGF